MMRLCRLCAVLFLVAGCAKNRDSLAAPAAAVHPPDFIKYTIPAGAHYATENTFQAVETSALSFDVRFDSTAIYKCTSPENQYDINKLYGFSDNGAQHHLYSARFGWRWSDGALRLFGYVYNEGNVVSKEIGTVPVGVVVRCRIVVTADAYFFYCNEWMQTLPRKSKTANGKGYLLYPYFGGDEAAPHEVHVWIKSV